MPYPVTSSQGDGLLRAQILIFLIFGGAIIIPSNAWAVQSPMSPEQLLSASDLVALVRVLSVTCLSVGQTAEHLRICSARLGLLKIRKGDFRKYDIVEVWWEETSRQVYGPWYVAYLPGEKVWTHLKWRCQTLETTWWNATKQVQPPQRNLPSEVMETVKASLWTRLPFEIANGLRHMFPH
jgi:hypothetical protein